MMREKKPNLIIVMPDELRQQSVGLTKTDPVKTENIDKFAKESLSLVNTVSSCPICSPARAMLLTGKYPISNGVIDNCYSKVVDYGIELKEDERCFSDVLKDASYNQGYIGKYHLDLPKEEDAKYTEGWRGSPRKGGTLWDAYTPPGARRHGFDFWYSYGCCDNHLSPHYWGTNAKIEEKTTIDEWSVKHETDVAIDYIRNEGGKYRDEENPFFLMVSHNPPHMPFHLVPEKYKKIYANKDSTELLNRPGAKTNKSAVSGVTSYFAAISGIDENFGRILATLDEEKLDETTIVIFMSDHGELLGSHGRMGKNAWQDEALLIPFILRWKGRIKARKDNLLFNMPDVMPTLLGLMGLSNQIPNDIEGVDHSAIVLGSKVKRPKSAYYLTAQPFFPEERRGLKTLTHTFVMIKERKTGALSYVLHDNINDPYQLKNSANEKGILVKKLKRELAKWLEKTNDPWISDNGLEDVFSYSYCERFLDFFRSRLGKK